MKQSTITFVLTLLISLMIATACNRMSEMISDPDAGMNGSFEIAQKELPVNWMLYTPNTVPEGEFNILLDDREYRHGKQSLRFDVVQCSSEGGWLSPGIAQEFPAEPGSRYSISFWIKNKGSHFTVSAGAVGPKTGEFKPLLRTEKDYEKWKQFEYIITIPEGYESLRFEVSITKPGTLWIDQVRMEKI
jgi:hypothetical protein